MKMAKKQFQICKEELIKGLNNCKNVEEIVLFFAQKTQGFTEVLFKEQM